MDRITATAANNFQHTFIQPMHLLVINFGLAHRLLSPLFIHLCATTLLVGFTHVHNQVNRVSGMDNTSFRGAFPGVLSDTPTECVTQCANVPSVT